MRSLPCLLLFFSLFLFQEAFATTGKIWSRTEMVEMAGYGEQKLSYVIITGSLLCDTFTKPETLKEEEIPYQHRLHLDRQALTISKDQFHSGLQNHTLN
ncbi:unnamed protein product [Eruca vesicaria subsp. sativa]|uniref:Uncharacterized protein n=1 Tax=Eruca vesicaria subsp. sativa TaxID=29727 RepID=A0ABC8J7C2_ERUVS|nr:unnamed protein product [Eruca vesicaria subsp. sativa]